MLESLFGRKRVSLNLKTLNTKNDGTNEQSKIAWEDQGNKFEDIDQRLRRQSSHSPNPSKTKTPSSPPNFDTNDSTVE